VPFTSQTAADLETVKARLAECEQSIADAELKLPNASLRLALGNAEPGDDAVGPRLKELHAERDLLRSALEAAEQQEADRREAAKQHELASTCRAATQHLSRLSKEMEAAAMHFANGQAAYARAVEASRSALASMPPKLRAAYWMAIAPKYLQRILLIETYQVAKRAGMTPVIPEMQGWAEDLKNWSTGNVAAFSTLLARAVEPIRAQLRQFIPSSSAGSPFLADDTAAAPENSSPVSGAAAPLDIEDAA
jgi:hypothetical protein